MTPVECSSSGWCFSGFSSFASADSVCFFVSLICLTAGGTAPASLPVWAACVGFGLGFLGDRLHMWGSHLYPLWISISLKILSFVVGA